MYMDDIMMYNETLNAHMEHLRLVFSNMRKYQLYVKKEKCEFCWLEMLFLCHWIGQGQIRIDGRNV